MISIKRKPKSTVSDSHCVENNGGGFRNLMLGFITKNTAIQIGDNLCALKMASNVEESNYKHLVLRSGEENLGTWEMNETTELDVYLGCQTSNLLCQLI